MLITVQRCSIDKGIFEIFGEWKLTLDECSFYCDKRKMTIGKTIKKTWL